MKTSELISPALDWAVALCEGAVPGVDLVFALPNFPHQVVRAFSLSGLVSNHYSPSTNWAQGGPIIEREKLALAYAGELWQAANSDYLPRFYDGPTPLIAAMRCYVASKLGDEVEIPKELL